LGLIGIPKKHKPPLDISKGGFVVFIKLK